jgi:hypothetical protein
MEEAAS